MFVLLKNNICVGVSELPNDEAHFGEDESQIELPDIKDLDELEPYLGCLYSDGEFIEPPKTDLEIQLDESMKARQFLRETDWQVTRHRDQIDMGITTSLADDEYKTLLTERQAAREKVVKVDDQPA